MYTTIEADIENGRIKSPEIRKLPAVAHVLITLLPGKAEKEPVTSPQDRTSLLARFAGAWQGTALVREEQGAYEARSELK
ncbi:MAG: hypothetical protein ISR84_01215 [Kiritimatiellales bacterium]|nr:hypothetical protein [Kiritimatiellota bacterium]MBL7016155.1 hypothetical protein [Kiritimatiellales bacterium]